MRALLLGGVAWNTMLYRDTLPDPTPGTTFCDRYHDAIGSSGAGKAMNLATLGVQSTLWGVVGDDAYADWIRAGLASFGVRFVEQVADSGTERHVNFMDANGDRLSVFVNPGPFELEVDTSVIVPELERADVVSVTIKNYCRAFLPVLAEAGVDVWVDIHDYDGVEEYHREFIEAADCLTMSSLKLDDWRGFLEGRIDAGAKVGVATHGVHGASAITASDGWIDVPAVLVDRVIDTNGAGDAFFAGFVAEWAGSGDLRASLESGTRQGALAVQSPELAPIPRQA